MAVEQQQRAGSLHAHAEMRLAAGTGRCTTVDAVNARSNWCTTPAPSAAYSSRTRLLAHHAERAHERLSGEAAQVEPALARGGAQQQHRVVAAVGHRHALVEVAHAHARRAHEACAAAVERRVHGAGVVQTQHTPCARVRHEDGVGAVLHRDAGDVRASRAADVLSST